MANDFFFFASCICMIVFAIIAIIYYFRCYNLMLAMNVSSWDEITSHYPQLKFLAANRFTYL
jgi:hypothetical protein